LQTLCRCQKPQLLCNQANPNSLRKTSGVGHLCDISAALCGSALSFSFECARFSCTHK
jgi:hypothetical protein